MAAAALHHLLLTCILLLPPLLRCQQPYQAKAATDCGAQHNSTSLLGYFCNGNSASCQAFLTFRSQPPHASVPAISSLLGADASRLSALNSVPHDFVFPTGSPVLVPVRCGCSGPHYQSNTTYTVKHAETVFSIASDTFQGLSTCQALQRQNSSSSSSAYIFAGMRITVPLRCACPTKNQTGSGTKYLLSYLVSGGDTVFAISQALGAGLGRTLAANGLSMSNALIYPATTLLVPLGAQPNITASPPPPPPPSRPPRKISKRTWVYVAAAVLSCLVVLPSFVFCVMHKKKKKAKVELSSAMTSENIRAVSSNKERDVNGLSERFLSKVSNIGQPLRVYEFEEVRAATEDFGEGRRIEGGVYRGVFDDGEVAAVKMVSRDVSREIDILKKISHFNVIKLQGLCFHEGHWFLVFEYAENGSLGSRIFDRSGGGGGSSPVLSWGQRVQIALDVASGLDYLHGYTEPAYVHKDIRSSNILLDGNMRAKIANFGMAASAESAEFAVTRHIVGTQGYMAPEYLQHGVVSPKLDVYAFGVTMAEIITGKDAVSLQRGPWGDGLSLDGLTAMVGKEEDEEARERIGSFIDPQLEGEFPPHSALLVARVIQGCVRKDPAGRPSMGEIVQSLSKSSRASLFSTEKVLPAREDSDYPMR